MQQQLLIDKLTNRINALKNHIQLLEGKVAIQEMINNLLEQKKQMTWKPTPEYLAQFYQEYRNLRKRCRRI